MCFYSRPPRLPDPLPAIFRGLWIKKGRHILQGPECHPFPWPVCFALLSGTDGEQERPRGREIWKRTRPLLRDLAQVFHSRARVLVNPDVKVYPKRGGLGGVQLVGTPGVRKGVVCPLTLPRLPPERLWSLNSTVSALLLGVTPGQADREGSGAHSASGSQPGLQEGGPLGHQVLPRDRASPRTSDRAARVHRRGRCAAAASALGQGAGPEDQPCCRSWHGGRLAPGRRERGHSRPQRQHRHRWHPRQGAPPGPAAPREARAGEQNQQPAAGVAASAGARQGGFWPPTQAARDSDSRTPARTRTRTHLRRPLTHTHSPRVQNRPVPRRAAGRGCARRTGGAPSAAG